MNTTPLQSRPITSKFLNWPPVDAMQRDQEQSHLLHEPAFRVSSTDPMTGHDIDDIAHRPSLVDGNLTVYFETGENRKAFVDMPVNHPSLHLPYPATDEDDRGG
jgi:hypothetical protein